MAGHPEERDPDEADSSWSPEVMARSYDDGRRAARRFVVAFFAAVIALDLAVAWLVAGPVVAIGLAAPQIIAVTLMLRRTRAPKTPDSTG